jgi:hypothetical protein
LFQSITSPIVVANDTITYLQLSFTILSRESKRTRTVSIIAGTIVATRLVTVSQLAVWREVVTHTGTGGIATSSIVVTVATATHRTGSNFTTRSCESTGTRAVIPRRTVSIVQTWRVTDILSTALSCVL